MTISAADSQISYAGNGISTTFSVPFPFDTAADIKILSTDSNGNVATLVTGFTVTGGGGSTGTVTFGTAPASGVTITILDNPLFTQPAAYASGDALPAESQERALDRVTRITKRLEQKIQRCVRTDDGDPASGPFMLFPTVAARRGRLAMWADSALAKLEPAVGLPAGTPLSQSIIGALLRPQSAAESSAGVIPSNMYYDDLPQIDVRRYGGSPAASAATNDLAIANAISVAYAMNGAEIVLVPGVWEIGQTIVLKHGVFLVGKGPNTYYAVPGTTLKPTATFAGTDVVRCDSKDSGSAPVCSGLGLAHIAIDMDRIAAKGIRAIVLRSVSNTRPFVNVTVLNHDHGNSLLIEKSAAAGALPNDGLEFQSFFTYSKTSDFSTAVPKLVLSYANETTFRGCKFQHRRTRLDAGSIAAYIGDNVLGATFDACAFAGAEFGTFIGNTDGGAPAEHVRFQNCIWESYRFGIYVRGACSSSDPNLYTKRMWAVAGNRFLTAQGANPRNIVLKKAIDCHVHTDEFIGGGTGTAYLVEATADSSGNYIHAAPGQVLDNGTNNVVYGRQGGALDIRRLFAEPLVGASLENSWTQFNPSNSSAVGYWKDRQGVVHIQGHITGGTVGGGRAFQLPAGYRPARNKHFAVVSNSAFGAIRISDAGDVFVDAGNNAWVSLDGISFRDGD